MIAGFITKMKVPIVFVKSSEVRANRGCQDASLSSEIDLIIYYYYKYYFLQPDIVPKLYN
jgi:hypothetical protein